MTGDLITRAAVESRLKASRSLLVWAVSAIAIEVARGLGVAWVPSAALMTNLMLVLVLMTLSQVLALMRPPLELSAGYSAVIANARVYGGSAVVLDVDDRPKRQGWVARIFARKDSRADNYWRARASIRPRDVEEAGTTRAQARAWMFSRGFIRPDWWQEYLATDGADHESWCHPDEPGDTITMPALWVDEVHDGSFTVSAHTSISRLIRDASYYVDIPDLDILDEMTAMVLDGEA